MTTKEAQTSWDINDTITMKALSEWRIYAESIDQASWKVKAGVTKRTGWVIYKNTSYYPLRMFLVPQRARLCSVPGRDRIVPVPKRERIF
jgi:hypothetical protein